MKMKLKSDQFVGLLLLIVGVYFAILTSQLPRDITPTNPGPKLFPYIATFGLVVCGAGIFVQSTLSKEEGKELVNVFTKSGWIGCVLALLILAAYTTLLHYVGFLISSPIMIFALTTLFAKGKNLKLTFRILFAVVLTVIVYILYTRFFGYKLPSGELFYMMQGAI